MGDVFEIYIIIAVVLGYYFNTNNFNYEIRQFLILLFKLAPVRTTARKGKRTNLEKKRQEKNL